MLLINIYKTANPAMKKASSMKRLKIQYKRDLRMPINDLMIDHAFVRDVKLFKTILISETLKEYSKQS